MSEAYSREQLTSINAATPHSRDCGTKAGSFNAVKARGAHGECRRALSIRQAHIDYHYAFDGIIEPVGDRIVTDDFDLSDLE
jgi:hypothetical protein